jgi:hypothetical protein
MSSKNLSFSLIDVPIEAKTDTGITYESLIKKVNEQSSNISNDFSLDGHSIELDDYIAAELDYSENYTKKQLDLIADYYTISKRKKRKAELIEEIVVFEKELSNTDIVQRRKTLWFYIEEINNDSFLSKFLILD